MSITKARLKVLRSEINAALAKAGITDFAFDVGTMRFTATSVKMTLTGNYVVKSQTFGDAVTAPVVTAILAAKVKEHGLKMVGNKGQKLTGYKPSRYKFPFSYTTVRGAQYKCTVEQAKAIFG